MVTLKKKYYIRKAEKKCEYRDQTSYSQLRVNHRKQVYSTEFTHSNQNTGKNWSTSLDLRAVTSRKLRHNSGFNHDYSVIFCQSGNIEKNIIFFSLQMAPWKTHECISVVWASSWISVLLWGPMKCKWKSICDWKMPGIYWATRRKWQMDYFHFWGDSTGGTVH